MGLKQVLATEYLSASDAEIDDVASIEMFPAFV